MFQTVRLAALLFVTVTGLAVPAAAQERETLGFGRVFNNDRLGDGRDRWNTGSYTISVLRGPGWSGALTDRPWDVVEYRFRGDIMTPSNLASPAPGDRLYAGTLSAGAHLHFALRGLEVAAGADVVVTGEQTGLRSLQASLHDALSLPQLRVDGFQVDNGVYLQGTVEVARDIAFAGGAIRPFVELQAGAETLARAGVDVTIGAFGAGGLRLRDVTTGQRVAGITGDDDLGFSFLLGGDVAYVDRSVFLPEDRGYMVEDERFRLRAGVNYSFGASNVFYGVTYLSEQFVGQPEGQVVGSLTLGLQF